MESIHKSPRKYTFNEIDRNIHRSSRKSKQPPQPHEHKTPILTIRNLSTSQWYPNELKLDPNKKQSIDTCFQA